MYGGSLEIAYDYPLYLNFPVCSFSRTYEGEQPWRMQTMRRFIYWLRRKWRIQEKRCGQYCLICPYYEECSGDYKKEKKAKIIQNIYAKD